jgi:hypothetical protein
VSRTTPKEILDVVESRAIDLVLVSSLSEAKRQSGHFQWLPH